MSLMWHELKYLTGLIFFPRQSESYIVTYTIRILFRVSIMGEQKFFSIEVALMNDSNMISVALIDYKVPDESGFYCIKIRDINTFPTIFSAELKSRESNVIYIGLASNSLKTRFLNQELRAKGHGTFFRSLGAILGYRPEEGSLNEKKNKRNYNFSQVDEQLIIDWINTNTNIMVNWVCCGSDFEALETLLIKKYTPLMNLAKNPLKLKKLTELRSVCVNIANA
jgi:hypothetical protein